MSRTFRISILVLPLGRLPKRLSPRLNVLETPGLPLHAKLASLARRPDIVRSSIRSADSRWSKPIPPPWSPFPGFARFSTLWRGEGLPEGLMGWSAIERSIGSFRVADIQKQCPGVGLDLIRLTLKNLRDSGQVECLGRGQSARWQKRLSGN